MKFIKLFKPLTINGLEISNRIVMPSMGLGYTDNYSFNDRYRAFYRERAEGGVGLMTIGPVAVDTIGSPPVMPGLFEDGQIGPLTEYLDDIHRNTDAKVAIQLMHMGRNSFSFDGSQPLAPSPIAGKLTKQVPKEMSREDIQTTIDSFAQAAVRGRTAGFDLVEIIACTGYLISQFLSPISNQRTDEYGGSIECRMRFGIEAIRAVRQAVGADMPLGIRIAGN
ncbi:MAG: NADH:flavin oxidoreductase, partial [Proteobacteria bacterium]|nr:NADH:flavin oxidoreductase [Pseudomonadota bacterium]